LAHWFIGRSIRRDEQGSTIATMMTVTPQELRARIDLFADQVIALCRTTRADPLTLRLLIQLQDSATSVAANYTSACRAQSRAAFIAKLSIAVEEADETVGWLQRLLNHHIGNAELRQYPNRQCRNECPDWQSAIVNGQVPTETAPAPSAPPSAARRNGCR
jgi:four helix bundle protein